MSGNKAKKYDFKDNYLKIKDKTVRKTDRIIEQTGNR